MTVEREGRPADDRTAQGISQQIEPDGTGCAPPDVERALVSAPIPTGHAERAAQFRAAQALVVRHGAPEGVWPVGASERWSGSPDYDSHELRYRRGMRAVSKRLARRIWWESDRVEVYELLGELWLPAGREMRSWEKGLAGAVEVVA